MMKTVDYILPEDWLPALVNDDLSGMSDAEALAFAEFIQDGIKDHGMFHCLGPVDDTGNGFMRYHDAHHYGIGSCDTYTVRFHVERN